MSHIFCKFMWNKWIKFFLHFAVNFLFRFGKKSRGSFISLCFRTLLRFEVKSYFRLVALQIFRRIKWITSEFVRLQLEFEISLGFVSLRVSLHLSSLWTPTTSGDRNMAGGLLWHNLKLKFSITNMSKPDTLDSYRFLWTTLVLWCRKYLNAAFRWPLIRINPVFIASKYKVTALHESEIKLAMLQIDSMSMARCEPKN